MPNERWIVLEDNDKHGKRFVSIEDTVKKIKYSNYFPLSVTDDKIIERFKAHVKEHRSDAINKHTTLDLTNFEAGL